MAVGTKTHWLKYYREKRKLSQEQLATSLQNAGLDVARSTVASWENPENSQPPLDDPAYRRALSNIFHISITELLIAAGYEVDPQNRNELSRRAADIIDQLSAEKQDLAIKLLEQFL